MAKVGRDNVQKDNSGRGKGIKGNKGCPGSLANSIRDFKGYKSGTGSSVCSNPNASS